MERGMWAEKGIPDGGVAGKQVYEEEEQVWKQIGQFG